MVRKVIEDLDNTRFDRAHFHKFGDSSLDFEVVYYVDNGDYNLYMDRQQAINLAMVRQFADKKIVFAYPTRSLFVESPVPVQMVSSPEQGPALLGGLGAGSEKLMLRTVQSGTG